MPTAAVVLVIGLLLWLLTPGVVSARGKTLLAGHTLKDEGVQRYTCAVEACPCCDYSAWSTGRHGQCSCGAVAPLGHSKSAVQRWHREHKDGIRSIMAAS